MNISRYKIMSGNQNYIGASIKITIITILFLIAGCGHLISPYNEIAYENATNLKVESLAMMQKATEPYSEHEQSVEQLNIKLDQAYEFAKGLPKNEITTRQWEIMINPEGNMLGGFLQKWKDDDSLNEVFVIEAKNQVSQGFDQIIELESAKIRE